MIDTLAAVALGVVLACIGWLGWERWLRSASEGVRLVLSSPTDLQWFAGKFVAVSALPAVATWVVGLVVRVVRRRAPAVMELGGLAAGLVLVAVLRLVLFQVAARHAWSSASDVLVSVDDFAPTAAIGTAIGIASITGLVLLLRRG